MEILIKLKKLNYNSEANSQTDQPSHEDISDTDSGLVGEDKDCINI
jgi:hypothetical protein